MTDWSYVLFACTKVIYNVMFGQCMQWAMHLLYGNNLLQVDEIGAGCLQDCNLRNCCV